MRILGIDYGEARTGLAMTDELGITSQGIQTIENKGNDKLILKKIDELLEKYDIQTIVVGMPYNLKCKYNKIKIDYIDERLTTVQAHKTMNILNINKHKKRNIVDTISAVYILESYMEKQK